LLEQLAAAGRSQNGSNQNGQSRPSSPFETTRDDRTGQTYLKVPMPDSQVLNQAYAAINTLMESFRK
jgi:hypothetical protein